MASGSEAKKKSAMDLSAAEDEVSREAERNGPGQSRYDGEAMQKAVDNDTAE